MFLNLLTLNVIEFHLARSVKFNTAYGIECDGKNCIDLLNGSDCGLQRQQQLPQKVNMKNKSTGRAVKVQELFSLSNGKQVSGVFDGGKMSILGGAPLVYMVEQFSHYVEGAAACIKDWRMQHLIKYELFSMVWQRVLLICAGYADGNDSNYLRHDAAVKLAMGLGIGDDDFLASQPTISRLENNLTSKDCYRIAAYMVMAYISQRKSPKQIVLDFDGSCVPVHGDQQGTAFRKHYNTNMYFPLFVYDEEGWLICAILRPGRDGEARLTVPVLKRLVKALRTAWTHVRIIVRADAAFGTQRLYDWCEDQGRDDERNVVYYIVCLKSPKDGTGVSVAFRQMRAEASKLFGKRFGPQQYVHEGAISKSALEKEIKGLDKSERKKGLKELRERTVRVFSDGRYRAGLGGKDPKQWRQERRVVAACLQDDWMKTSRYFVTNLPANHEYQPQYLIEELYSARGGMELRIKEYKALKGDKLSCREFSANQARLIFHALAYNTMYQLRESLPGARHTWSFQTIQNYLIRIAAKISRKGNEIVMHWASDFQWKREFWTCVTKLRPQNA